MIDFIFGFTLLNKTKRYEVLMMLLQILLISLVAFKVANSFGYYYNEKFEFTMKDIIQYIFSGNFVSMIFFIFIAYVTFIHAVGMYPYLISTFWNKKIYDINKHIKDLEVFDIIYKSDCFYEKGENYNIYLEIIDDIDNKNSISKTIKQLFSVITTFIFCLFAYGVIVKLWLMILIILLWLNIFINVVFFTIKIRQIKTHKREIMKSILDKK